MEGRERNLDVKSVHRLPPADRGSNPPPGMCPDRPDSQPRAPPARADVAGQGPSPSSRPALPSRSLEEPAGRAPPALAGGLWDCACVNGPTGRPAADPPTPTQRPPVTAPSLRRWETGRRADHRVRPSGSVTWGHGGFGGEEARVKLTSRRSLSALLLKENLTCETVKLFLSYLCLTSSFGRILSRGF